MSGRGTAIKEFVEAIGRAFRGPVPAPKPAPAPAPPRPAPTPTPPRPNPIPPRDPQPTPPRRPVPPPRDVETETQPETQTEPETAPDGQTETEGATKLDDDPHCETCPECAARDMGEPVTRAAPQSRDEQRRGYDYQHFVCPWHWYDPAKAEIQEWNFSGVDFDGLHPTECHLYEAKHGYDGFLEDDWANGVPKLRRWVRNSKNFDTFDRFVKQAQRQHNAVVPHFGEVYLTWVFSHMITQLYVGDLLSEKVEGWYHEMEERPWESG